jgi:hypothetical protein
MQKIKAFAMLRAIAIRGKNFLLRLAFLLRRATVAILTAKTAASNDFRILSHGIDTLWVGLRGIPVYDMHKQLEGLQEESRERLRKKQDLAELVIGQDRWKVRPFGADIWQFYLEHCSGMIDVACYPKVMGLGNKPDVRIRFGSEACWNLGKADMLNAVGLIKAIFLEPELTPEQLQAHEDKMELEKELYARLCDEELNYADPNYVAKKTQLKRLASKEYPSEYVASLHLCADVQGWNLKPEDEEFFIGRFRRQFDNAQGKRKSKADGEAIGAVRSHKRNRTFTGFEFGKSPLKTNIYRKDVEIEKSKKRWFFKIWQESGNYKEGEPVLRLEPQLRREVLATFSANGKRIDTLKDTLESLDMIWQYVLTSWIRQVSTKSDCKQYRHRPTAEHWQALQGINWQSEQRTIERVHQRQSSLDSIMPQLVGLLVHAAALASPQHAPGPYSSTAALAPKTWAQAAAAVELEVYDYLQRKGKTIAQLIEKYNEERAAQKEEDCPF